MLPSGLDARLCFTASERDRNKDPRQRAQQTVVEGACVGTTGGEPSPQWTLASGPVEGALGETVSPDAQASTAHPLGADRARVGP